MKILDNKIINLYNNIKDKLEKENNYILNISYYYYKLKKEFNNKDNKLDNKEILNINYIIKLRNLLCQIRKFYIKYIVFTNKINNIYNYNNKQIIFMGEQYLFLNYSLKDKTFDSFLFQSFLPDKDDSNFNNYKIEYLSDELIILNDKDKKIIYEIEILPFYLLKKKYKYFSNILINEDYLLFDTIKENNIIQFSFIDLSNGLINENQEINDLLNLKFEYNYPKIILFSKLNKFIYLYDVNQLCIIDYIFKEKENKDEKAKPNNKKIINGLKILKKNVIIKIIEHSGLYSDSYHPLNLFNNSSYYYCSNRGANQFFELDFSNEYFLLKYDITYNNSNKNCIPKKYIVQIYDNKKREINKFEFINTEKKNETRKINEMARYIRFNFLENFGGNYIIIQKMNFTYKNLYDI